MTDIIEADLPQNTHHRSHGVESTEFLHHRHITRVESQKTQQLPEHVWSEVYWFRSSQGVHYSSINMASRIVPALTVSNASGTTINAFAVASELKMPAPCSPATRARVVPSLANSSAART